MKRFTAFVALVLLAAATAVSCSKDKDAGKLAFDRPAVFLQPGGTATVGFSSTDIKSYSISSKPVGWDDAIVLDEGAMSVRITAPTVFEDDARADEGTEEEEKAERSGTLTLAGTSFGGEARHGDALRQRFEDGGHERPSGEQLSGQWQGVQLHVRRHAQG